MVARKKIAPSHKPGKPFQGAIRTLAPHRRFLESKLSALRTELRRVNRGGEPPAPYSRAAALLWLREAIAGLRDVLRRIALDAGPRTIRSISAAAPADDRARIRQSKAFDATTGPPRAQNGCGPFQRAANRIGRVSLTGDTSKNSQKIARRQAPGLLRLKNTLLWPWLRPPTRREIVEAFRGSDALKPGVLGFAVASLISRDLTEADLPGLSDPVWTEESIPVGRLLDRSDFGLWLSLEMSPRAAIALPFRGNA